MVSALSSQQLSALGGLLDLNSSMAELQNRVSTGKKINSVFDDPTKFLLAGRLNDRADALLATNKQIDFGITAITSAQKALTKLKTDFTNALGDLKTLKGLTQTTAAQAANPTNATILGDGRVAAGEVGAATTSVADLQKTGITASAAAITANKRVFGAAAAAATNANNGTLGVNNAAGTTALRVVIATTGAVGTALGAQANATQIDIGAADVSDGSNNLANLTLADVVRKINSATNTSAALGAGNKLKADIDATGRLTLGVIDANQNAVTAAASNFRVQIGTATAATAANAVVADANANFGLVAIAGAAGQAAAATQLSGLAPTAAERGTLPPDIATRVLTDANRAIFDNDADTSNNGPGWSLANGFTTGNYGFSTTNTLSVAVKNSAGATTYLDVANTDIAGANNTLSGLAAALNTKAANLIPNFNASVDPISKQLTIRAGVGTTIGVGTGATTQSNQVAHDNAAAGLSNVAFGLTDKGATAAFTTAAPGVQDASGISLLGNAADSFQDGDTFAITVTNTTNPSDTRQIRFQATAAGNVPTSFTSTSGTATDPYKFNTLQQLAQAITTAFNSNQLSAAATKLAGTGTGTTASQFQLNLTLGSAFSLDIEQVTNAAGGTTTTPSGVDTAGIPNLKNSANALEKIFGQKNDTAVGGLKSSISAESLLSTIDLRDTSGKLTGHQQDYGKKISYTRIAAAAAQDGDPKRAAVSANLSKVLDQIAGVVTDSQVSGQPNLLNGAALTVQLSEKQDRSTTIQIGQAVNTDNLGFAAATGGAAGYALLQGLGSDTDVDAAIKAFTDAAASIDSFAYTLGSQSTSFVSWQNLNTALSSTLTTSATGIVATDTTADSVQLQAQSTRYSLATSALGLLNQAAQSAVQLLR